MPSDPEPGDEQFEPRVPPQPRRVGLPPEVDRRAGRSLGRGFEDIADTFLSRKPAKTQDDGLPGTGGPGDADSRDVPVREPASNGGPSIVRSGMRASKDQVTAALKNFAQEIEAGLRIIDSAVPCGPAGDIDLLAVDRATRLVIVNISVESGADLLLASLAQADWVVRNIAVVRRMYAGQLIDFSQEPRICLVASRLSPIVEAAVRHVTNKVMCLTFRDLELPGRLGITLERAGTND